MRQATKAEFFAHVGSFGAWVDIKHMYTARCNDHVYSFKGFIIGQKTELLKRGKVYAIELSICEHLTKP